jgi:hypothetical protein
LVELSAVGYAREPVSKNGVLRLTIKKPEGGKLNWIKYFIWVPWVSIIMSILAGGFHAINSLHLTETGISVSEPANYVIYFTIAGLFVKLPKTLKPFFLSKTHKH